MKRRNDKINLLYIHHHTLDEYNYLFRLVRSIMLNLKSFAYEQVKYNCQTQCSESVRKRKCLNCYGIWNVNTLYALSEF